MTDDVPLVDRLAQDLPVLGVGASLSFGVEPDPLADLVLTRVRPGRSLGRLRLALPEYRLVSRSDPAAWTPEGALP